VLLLVLLMQQLLSILPLTQPRYSCPRLVLLCEAMHGVPAFPSLTLHVSFVPTPLPHAATTAAHTQELHNQTPKATLHATPTYGVCYVACDAWILLLCCCHKRRDVILYVPPLAQEVWRHNYALCTCFYTLTCSSTAEHSTAQHMAWSIHHPLAVLFCP
jgi:hypothetical protein